ncbi:drug/metabolite transporter (DMT)-like permease [Acidovorax soli]|uniref:Drug/metabolite transporter (DMT)-like permease n=1 Tax=Acidovorax soli TaxID=592050 RepID=A0A7X0PKT2_9BURK|nr:DMT family transporter [Acidovorax soli]MBB6563795.1 drug/metabolite transporter (DMT)-like permease [Acidovorax soli]
MNNSKTAIPSPAGTQAAPQTSTHSAKAWMVDLLLLAALWGASFLFMRMGAAEFGALPTAATRVGIGALFLFPLMMSRGQGPALVQHWRASMALGVFNSGLPFALFSFALLTINSSLAAVLNATTPMFGALVAWVWFRERPSGWRLVGLAIGFIGVVMLASGSAGLRDGDGADNHAALWAIGACLLACLCYGIAASATRRYLTGVPPLATATGSQIGAALLLAVPAILYWPQQMPSLRAWLAIAALGVLCTGVAYFLFFRLIERAGPARALTVTFLLPVFATFYGVAFLDERITQWMLVCAAVIVCGVGLSTGFIAPKSRAAKT